MRYSCYAARRKEGIIILKISIIFEESTNRSAAYDGEKQIGECEFDVVDGVWAITHTGVCPEYGGKGIAGKLVEKVIEEARSRNAKIQPLCSYAKKKF